MTATRAEKGLAAAAVLLAAFYAVIGLLVWAGVGDPGSYPRPAWGLVGLLAGALILLGLRANKQSPFLGAALMFVGAVPLAVLFAWGIIPAVLAGLMVLFWARARWVAGTGG